MASRRSIVAVAITLAGTIASCSSSSSPSTGGGTIKPGTTVTLLTYDSFATSDGLFDTFTKSTGIKVVVAKGADAGIELNKAILTKGKPAGDLLWGVDNTLLSRAVQNKVFTPYTPSKAVLADTDPAALALSPTHELTPVDRGDVCVNVDREWFEAKGVPTPTKLADLVAPAYKGLTVVQNPSTSSPGLAFLMATVVAYGDKWPDFWKQLRANDVKVADGWTTAYSGDFTRAKGGTRPIVVSYGTSPAFEVDPAADPATVKSPTSVMTDSCFRQVEFVGVLKGTKNQAAAEKLIDFMLGDAFQADIPVSLYVFPIRPSIALPPAFKNYGVLPDKPLSLDPKVIETKRDAWLKTWNDIVLG
jgi:thiamine transport system substrate-binding protein